MPLSAGERLGPYEILAPLGAGGMGEVYRAHDTRLKREVALKILPEALAHDPVRRQRFEQEARAVAALNHPNIVAIYDIGSENGVLYIVTELVDGETLNATKLSLRRTLDCAVQIATGLAAAHTALITHRDLKPANILLTRDGRIKILDFGLAKMAAVPSAFQSDIRSGLGDTETLPLKTDPGVVMGTVGYMSPEQVKGLVADHRSDIFSFGVILHELLSGRRAFHRDTAVETMRAILKEDPPELPDSVPAAVRQVAHHCLEKEPENRFQSARDLAFALSAMAQGSGGSSIPTGPALSLPVPSPWPKRAMIAAAALVLIGIGVAGGRILWHTPEAPSWSGGVLGGPEMALDPRISPDGSLLAFQAMDDGLTQVAVMKPESGNWSILTHNRERGTTFALAWSADGASIYYDRRTDVPQGIYSVPLLGGDERLVLEKASNPEPLPDGSLLVIRFNPERKTQLFRFWPESGRLQDLPVIVYNASSPGHPMRTVPGGKQAVIFGNPLGREDQPPALLLMDLDSGAMRSIATAERLADFRAWAVTRDGQSVIASTWTDSLLRIVSIPLNGPLNGRAPPQTLFTATNLAWYLDAAPDGSVYISLMDRPTELVGHSSTGGRTEHIASFPQVPTPMLVELPDGRAVIAERIGGRNRLMVVEKGKQRTPLISTAEETSTPITAAGPHGIAFMIGTEPHQTLAVADTASGRIERRIPLNKGTVVSLASSLDAKTLYAAAGGAIWAISSTNSEPRMIRAGDSVAMDPSGRYLLICANEASKSRLFRLPLEGGAETEVNLDPKQPLMGTWFLSPSSLNADGRLLFPLQPLDSWFSPIGLVDTATGRVTRLATDDVSDYHSLAWLPDGRILALRVGLRSTLWRFQPRK
jgi:eukaryotic-like serine/threonine-protein kinase